MTTEPAQTSRAGEKSPSAPAPLWKRRWLRVLTYITVIVAAILVAIPIVAKHQLQQWLIDNGADHAQIENIDFNPLYGTFELHGLDVKVADKTVLSDSVIYLDIAWNKLLQKGIVLEKVTLQSVTVDVEQLPDQGWRVGSLILGATGERDEVVAEEVKEEITWWLGLDKVEMKDSSVTITSPQLNAVLYLDEVVIDGFHTRGGETEATIALKLRLNEAPINAMINVNQHTPFIDVNGNLDVTKIDLAEFFGLAGDALQKLAGMVDIKGDFDVQHGPGVDTNLAYKGILEVKNSDVANPVFATTGESSRWDGSVKLTIKDAGATRNASVNGTLTTTVLSVKLPEQSMDASTGSINWQGEVNYTAAKAGQGIDLKGQLEGKDVAVAMGQQNLRIRQQGISATPELQLNLGGESTGLAGNAKVKVNGLSVTDTAKQLILLAVESLGVDGIKAESLEKASVAGINIGGMSLIQGKDSESPFLTIGDTKITALDWGGKSGLGIKHIALNKLTGLLTKEKDGRMNLIKALQGETDASIGRVPARTAEKTEVAPDSTRKKTGSSQPMPIRLGQVTVQQDSSFTFLDNSVSPRFKATLDIASLTVKDIDSSKPDQPAAINLDGKLDNYATLGIHGSVKPFAEQPGVDLSIELDGQNMVGLSPYMVAATGYMIRAGQLDLDSKIVIDQGAIDAQNKFFVKKLNLKEADSATAKKNSGSIGMPLDKAIGMLADKNGNITLEVPVQGNLDEVEVGLGNIINTALKQATTRGMKSYLLYAFQPYGALISVGQKIGKEAGKIRLDPIVFEPEQSELTDGHKDYLAKLGKVMTERPQIIVQLCGFTTATDLFGEKAANKKKAAAELSKRQSKKMSELGSARQRAIKDHMISTYKIDDGRVITCAPEHDQAIDAKPRVELLI